MPHLDPFKRMVPTVGTSDANSDSPPNIQKAFEDFSRSLRAYTPVASDSEATLLAADTPKDGYPLFVYRTDIHEALVKETPGGAWRHVGGAQHAIEADTGRTADPSTTTPLHIHNLRRVSEGWEISGGAAVIPVDGMYLVQCLGTVEGVYSGNPARRFLQYSANDEMKQRWSMAGDTVTGGMDMRFFKRGTKIMMQGYHELSGRQVIRSTMQIVQIASPRWTAVQSS